MSSDSQNSFGSEPIEASDSLEKESFFPKGAIAFFVALLLFFAAVWLFVYGLMIYRQYAL